MGRSHCCCCCPSQTPAALSTPNNGSRNLQSPTLPPGTSFNCPAGEQPFKVGWAGVDIIPDAASQTVTLPNGFVVDLTTEAHHTATLKTFKKTSAGDLDFAGYTYAEDNDVIESGVVDPALTYPRSYVTLGITFHEALSGVSISIGDIDSGNGAADVTRIRMEDETGSDVPVSVTANTGISVVGNFAFQGTASQGASNPGHEASMYATTDSTVKTIYLDQTSFVFGANQVGKKKGRHVFPALDFRYCAPPVPPTPSPTPIPPDSPGPAPVCVPTRTMGTETFDDGPGERVNGVVETEGAFGSFLGRYGKGSAIPTKTYSVNPDAASITLKFNFYEIDSWDAQRGTNEDALKITINGYLFTIGYFDFQEDETSIEGQHADSGITWENEAQGDPAKIGFAGYDDQIHLVTVEIPASVYASGTLDVSLNVELNQGINDESAGFDNFELLTHYDCDKDNGNGGGVNGDPLIMGLAGQLFKFDGRSGAWYSAVSAKSFQWNMKIQEYDECPADSNKFVSGVGFTVFKNTAMGRTPAHKIAVNVVNEFGTQTGCGTDATNCLGNGSLELIIDDKKYVYPGDYQLKDGSGRVIAFNTFLECSRKWYDFDITPANEGASSRSLRRLSTFPGVFDVVRGLEDTMVDKDACDDWIAERQSMNDLFHQAGAWSTIIVKTEDISFHIEYKQETKRCDAHTVDVWISSVSPELYDEGWEGVIGETKDPANHAGEKVDRSEFLKYDEDESYEVVSPFAYKCDGCVHH